jgi:hypothetical protein
MLSVTFSYCYAECHYAECFAEILRFEGMGGSEELKLLLVRKFEPRRVKDDDGRAGGDAAEEADEDVARPWRFLKNFFATLFTLWCSKSSGLFCHYSQDPN